MQSAEIEEDFEIDKNINLSSNKRITGKLCAFDVENIFIDDLSTNKLIQIFDLGDIFDLEVKKI